MPGKNPPDDGDDVASPLSRERSPDTAAESESDRADAPRRKTLSIPSRAQGTADAGDPAATPRKAGIRARFKPSGLKPVKPATASEPRRAGGGARPAATGSAVRSRDRASGPPGTQARAPQRKSEGGGGRYPERSTGSDRERPAKGNPEGPAERNAEYPRGRERERRAERVVTPAALPGRSATTESGPAPEGVRLSKVMAERGLCSRREADQFIERGWVVVDGRRVSELGTRIDPNAQVVLAPEAEQRQATQVTMLLHKPVGYVSGQPEPGYEPAVMLVGADTQFDRDVAQRFHPSHLRGLAPAGRLDIDSTGLLVLTQNGRIARQLIGEDSKVEKEYIVRVEGELDAEGLALLNHGLELDGRRLRPAKVEWINDDQLRFVLREGRKRQIRRMCELVGLKVVGLKRTRIGRVRLGELPVGQWRFLREDERF